MFTQDFNVLGSVSVDQISKSSDFKQVKDGKDHSLEEGNS